MLIYGSGLTDQRLARACAMLGVTDGVICRGDADNLGRASDSVDALDIAGHRGRLAPARYPPRCCKAFGSRLVRLRGAPTPLTVTVTPPKDKGNRVVRTNAAGLRENCSPRMIMSSPGAAGSYIEKFALFTTPFRSVSGTTWSHRGNEGDGRKCRRLSSHTRLGWTIDRDGESGSGSGSCSGKSGLKRPRFCRLVA
jgi:hypothetical protein